MISTTGRSPVIAAPTATPVNPASEIGVSLTRSFPNSSTSPESTLKGVPASATSSPRMHTRASRRISSAIASRTASPSVNSRTATSGIDILRHLVSARIGGLQRKFDGGENFGLHLRVNFIELAFSGMIVSDDPITMQLDRIALRHPALLFLLRAVILAINVSDVVPAIAVRVAQ